MLEHPFVIFLDHDGVTHNWKDWCNPNYRMGTILKAVTENSGYHALNRFLRVENLHVTLIPVSSWGNVMDDYEESTKEFEKAELNNLHLLESDVNGVTELCHHIGKDNLGRMSPSRVTYIKRLIEKLNLQPNQYVILDDDYAHCYKYHKLTFIHTHIYEGITQKNMNRLREIVTEYKVSSGFV